MSVAIADRIHIVEGPIDADITRLPVDAIVNAANESLQPGGGVCGAIHDAAGPGLEQECRRIGRCPTGEARLTGGYRLPAKHVIHAVGPRGTDPDRADLLRSCYKSILRIAAEHRLATIALPNISTGIFGYPKDEACAIATGTVVEWLRGNEYPRAVTFCCFDAAAGHLCRTHLAHMPETQGRQFPSN